ncbi:MAG: hypothetical protein ACYC2Y_05900 [Armatimonadota bacterium]
METSVLLIAIFTGIIALANLLLLAGLAFLAFAVKKLIDQAVMPAVKEAKETVENLNEMVERVEQKAERIMDIGEETARRVGNRVVATSDVVQETVASPLINISSFITGIQRGIETWRYLSQRRAVKGVKGGKYRG